jgi:hypothetical protein
MTSTAPINALKAARELAVTDRSKTSALLSTATRQIEAYELTLGVYDDLIADYDEAIALLTPIEPEPLPEEPVVEEPVEEVAP